MTSASPPGLIAGQRLGPYELLLPVAQGGMGTVWAARAPGGARAPALVALKTMLPALSSDPRFERMFLSESRIASRIHHPNVCAVLDHGEQGGVLYFAMEWVDGDSLLALLGGSSRHRRSPLPYPVAVRIGIEAALGLHAAHELRRDDGALIGVVHRDVSPHNILVTREGQVKIVDFGIAKAMAQTEGATTSTGQMRGKAHFMSPEQIIGDALDRRTDIFALGTVLYQLTTGTHPFAATHDLATMAKITRADPVAPPSSLLPDYPPDLEAAVLRALAKTPDDRFASMADFAAALEAVEARLGAPREEVTTFLRGALAERAAKRSGLIQEALRALKGKSALDAPTQPSPGIRALHEGRGRALLAGVALLAGGALIGAAVLVWLRERAEAAAPVGAASASAGAHASAHVEPTAAPADPQPPEEPALPAVDPGRPYAGPPAATTPATAAPPPPSAAPLAAPSSSPSASGRAKFREPGF